MGKFEFAIWLTLASIALCTRLAEGQYELPASPLSARNIFTHQKISGNGHNKTPMHKAILTQRGYIQFLRWELPVPEIEEFTFCLWVKSVNLTHSHSIFSYSLNEKERLVSSWISPFGRSIHLEIGGIEIMEHPTLLEEHRWYHICQSWDNRAGHYALWINGRKEVEGYSIRLVGHVIPKSGDIVVGQEYTDFDKGLEEGIEGAVLGFNLLLISAFDRASMLKYFNGPIDQSGRNLPPILSPNQQGIPDNRDFGRIGIPSLAHLELRRGIPLRRSDETNDASFVPYPEERQRIVKKIVNNNHPMKIVNERREGAFESTLKEYLGDEEIFGSNFQRRNDDHRRGVVSLNILHKNKRDLSSRGGGISRRRIDKTPLGLQLINLSYEECQLGRGSPFIGGSKMLISWTRTPVKVFGGAILKNAKSTCGNF